MQGLLKTAQAEKDLIDIWLYTFENWGERQADNYLEKIESSLSYLRENSELGKSCGKKLPGYSQLIVGEHVVFYRNDVDLIIVVRVLNQNMDVRELIIDE